MFKLDHLRCEYAVNPLGIDNPKPRFTWELHHTERGQAVTACQVLAATSIDGLKPGKADLWDSGKIYTGENFPATYAGETLKSRQRVYWCARAWDNQDRPGEFSQPAWFEMGLLKPEDWWAEWVGFPAGWSGKALLFRHEFTVSGEVRSARAYIAGLGYSELSLNGKKVGDRVLDPATTSYAKRILYTTYDITDLLCQGLNVAGVVLAGGWYGARRLLCQIHIDYTDGTSSRVVTGRTGEGGSWWRVAEGPIQHTSIYDGETYDARLEKPGWDTPAYNPQQFATMDTWMVGMMVDPPGGTLQSGVIDPIRVVDTLKAKSITQPKPGVFVLDTGQNLSGWARLRVQGKRGARVTLRFAESLYPDGTVNQENLRSARATDEYIAKGEGIETWEPSFTYHGFRYIQVEGYPGEVTASDVEARFVRSDTRPTGEFECSSDLLNRIHRMVWWTEASNQHSIPTDCPQRDERMGWLNDLAARSEEAFYNFDMARFFAKFIADINDAQDPVTGAITDTAPYRWGSRPADPVSVCYLLFPWLLYQHYGDKKTMADHFSGMKSWVDYLTSRAKDGILQYSYYGDWAEPLGGRTDESAVSVNTPGLLVSTAFYAYSAELLARMAGVLGKKGEAAKYTALHDEIVAAFNREYWNEQTGGYGTNSEACNAIALYMHLVPEENIQRTIQALSNAVAAANDHPTTGNLCTKYLLEILAETGCEEQALRLATHTSYPSWGYMLKNGATTLWERWEKATGGGMNSHNHPMYGSVDSWLYKAAGGITLEADAVAFNHFAIRPRLVGGLTSTRACLLTVQGEVLSDWKVLPEGVFEIKVTVPAGCRAKVYIPAKDRVMEGSTVVWQDGAVQGTTPGIIKISGDGDGELILEVGSGEYSFRAG